MLYICPALVAFAWDYLFLQGSGPGVDGRIWGYGLEPGFWRLTSVCLFIGTGPHCSQITGSDTDWEEVRTVPTSLQVVPGMMMSAREPSAGSVR